MLDNYLTWLSKEYLEYLEQNKKVSIFEDLKSSLKEKLGEEKFKSLSSDQLQELYEYYFHFEDFKLPKEEEILAQDLSSFDARNAYDNRKHTDKWSEEEKKQYAEYIERNKVFEENVNHTLKCQECMKKIENSNFELGFSDGPHCGNS